MSRAEAGRSGRAGRARPAPAAGRQPNGSRVAGPQPEGSRGADPQPDVPPLVDAPAADAGAGGGAAPTASSAGGVAPIASSAGGVAPTAASAGGASADSSPVDGVAAGVSPVGGDSADGSPVGGLSAPGSPVDGVSGDAATGAPPKRAPWAGWDPTIRVAGLVVSILAAFFSGALELLLTTLRSRDFTAIWQGDPIGSAGGPLIPVSVLLAIVLNYGIAWFAVSTTRRRWALGPPWALWTLMMFAASGVRTSEGDYLLAGENWVALVTILVGSLSFAVYSYRMILKRVTP